MNDDSSHATSPLDFYFARIAAAYVRGTPAAGDAVVAARPDLFATPLDRLAPEHLEALIRLGLEKGLRLHRFKRTMGLPRVARVLGLLRGLNPAELLDVGSGRGVFLWPLLDAFPDLPVMAIDSDERRVAVAMAVRAGGLERLHARALDVTKLDLPDNGYDVVTMLEVLEHIPATERALAEVVRVARRFVVLSVPSKPDNNPEHIHLFDANTLTRLLLAAGAVRVQCDHVLNHIVAVARVS